METCRELRRDGGASLNRETRSRTRSARDVGVVLAPVAAFVMAASGCASCLSRPGENTSPPHMATGPADSGPVGCVITASGAIAGLFQCRVLQPFSEDNVIDAGAPVLVVHEWPMSSDVGIRIGIMFAADGDAGQVQYASASIRRGDREWTAKTPIHEGELSVQFSRIDLTPGSNTYELHGRVNAVLLPTWQSKALGTVSLSTEF